MTILLFGPLKDVLGCSQIEWPVPVPLTRERLWAALANKYPALAPYRSLVRLARNQEFATPDTLFYEPDEAALIPPVSGG